MRLEHLLSGACAYLGVFWEKFRFHNVMDTGNEADGLGVKESLQASRTTDTVYLKNNKSSFVSYTFIIYEQMNLWRFRFVAA